MGLLPIITPLLGAAAVLALILCMVCALLNACEWIEQHPSRSTLLGKRVGQATALVIAATTALDGLPWTYGLCGLVSAVLVIVQHNPSRLDVPMQGRHSRIVALCAICVSSILAHLALIHHFHKSLGAQNATGTDALLRHIEPQDRARERLPGGRIDWDVYDDQTFAATQRKLYKYTSAQQLTALVICWLPALWTLLCRIAQSGSLPITTPTSARQSSKLSQRARRE